MPDNSSLLPASAPFAHFLEFFCLHGAPANAATNPAISIVANHGYALGYAPDRGQPLWAAYQVAAATRDLDFERPEFFYDDPRLPEDWRIGTRGYGKVDGKTHDCGHMVPNFAINTQFGRVAQFETFFMSNIVPQRSSMNRGIWKNLEHGIVKAYAPLRKHVWVLTGPVFAATPPLITRPSGKTVPVPEALFLIIADPERYPFDDADNLNILALLIPQDIRPPSLRPRQSPPCPRSRRGPALRSFRAYRPRTRPSSSTRPARWSGRSRRSRRATATPPRPRPEGLRQRPSVVAALSIQPVTKASNRASGWRLARMSAIGSGAVMGALLSSSSTA